MQNFRIKIVFFLLENRDYKSIINFDFSAKSTILIRNFCIGKASVSSDGQLTIDYNQKF
jgi:ubiquitin C-terminal hydrolase